MTEDTLTPTDAGEMQDEDLDTLQSKIADQLAELSLAEATPVGSKLVTDPFEANEVDFVSSGWLLRVLQVQIWLNPDAEIDRKTAEVNPLASATTLFTSIGAKASSECVVASDAGVQLTVIGADYLATRLDTALKLQAQFQESRETLTNKQATEQWGDAWEETGNVEVATEPIRAKSDTWRINDFSGKASKGLLNLTPSYQRGDVWPTRDAQKLIESILRGIPLPSIILLKPASANRQAKWEVVDGKQRLTSILRFIGQHPKALERVKEMNKRHPEAKLEENFKKDYKKFRQAWKTVVGEPLSDKTEAEYYFPFRLAKSSPALTGPLGPLAGKYFYEIVDENIHVGEGQETVSDVFERSSEYKIPLIEYLDASPKQIHEVFHLYNRQGMHLNAEEIRNALFHDVDLARLVLVASGDNPSPSALAPYIPETEVALFGDISRCLGEYRFGSARYKRTKLLSWLFAILFQPSVSDTNELTVRSTAKQIDTLLTSIRAAVGIPAHKLSDQHVLIELVRDTDKCLEAHSSADCWDARFKDDEKGQKWQELQLVASLVAVFLIGVVNDSPETLLENFRVELLTFTQEHRRPEKTQNKTQWAYIGEVALGIINVTGLDEGQLEQALQTKYGVSCLPTLHAAKALYKPRAAD